MDFAIFVDVDVDARITLEVWRSFPQTKNNGSAWPAILG
jgi:hypothetical protein